MPLQSGDLRSRSHWFTGSLFSDKESSNACWCKILIHQEDTKPVQYEPMNGAGKMMVFWGAKFGTLEYPLVWLLDRQYV